VSSAFYRDRAGGVPESKLTRVGRDVFISYAEEDKTIAALACKRLEDVGVSCWMAPRDILPGRTWAASIIEAIESSRAMVLVLSQNSAASRQVAREVERADALRLPLVTIRVDATELSGDLEYFLSNTQWLDATQGRIEEQLAPLPRYVRMLLSAQRRPAERPQGATPLQRTKRELHAVVAAWFAVLTRGHNGVATFALQEFGTLLFALRFGLYMVVAGAVISFPVAEAAQRRPLAYFLSYVVSSIAEIGGGALIVHTSFRLMGGGAGFASSMSAWCLYLTFWPLLVVSLAPANAYFARMFEGDPVSGFEKLAARMSPADIPVLLVCFAASTVALILFARGVLTTLRALHGLTVMRTVAAALLALAGCLVFLLVIAFPFESALYR
jgi:hypothetical protein